MGPNHRRRFPDARGKAGNGGGLINVIGNGGRRRLPARRDQALKDLADCPADGENHANEQDSELDAEGFAFLFRRLFKFSHRKL